MSTTHPDTGDVLLNVKETADYLTSQGLPTSVASLNSDRSNGSGPKFLKIGRNVYYRTKTLNEYVRSKTTDEVNSTSELMVAKQLMIEDKSQTRSNGGSH
jgi:hypothetical protein